MQVLSFIILLQASVSAAVFTRLKGNWTANLIWKQNLADQVNSSPILTRSDLFIGSNSNEVFCLDRLSGQVKWTFETMGKVKATGVTGVGTFYIGSYDSNLYALNTANGAPLWDHETVGPVMVAPVLSLDDGVVLFGSQDGAVTALDSVNGAVVWSVAIDHVAEHQMAVRNKRVFFGSSNNFLYCFKAKNGNKLWEFDTGGVVTTGAVLDEAGRVFIGSDSKLLIAVQESDGALIWTRQAIHSLKEGSEFLVNNGMIYVLTADNVLHALQTSDGASMWSFDCGNTSFLGPIAADTAGTIFVTGVTKNALLALNGTDGTPMWSYAVGGKVKTKPAFWSNDTVYFGANDNFVYALKYVNTAGPIIPNDDDDDSPSDDDKQRPDDDGDDNDDNNDDVNSNTTDTAATSNNGIALTTASISGIAIGSVVFVFLLICLIYLIFKTEFLVTYGCKKKEEKKTTMW